MDFVPEESAVNTELIEVTMGHCVCHSESVTLCPGDSLSYKHMSVICDGFVPLSFREPCCGMQKGRATMLHG